MPMDKEELPEQQKWEELARYALRFLSEKLGRWSTFGKEILRTINCPDGAGNVGEV